MSTIKKQLLFEINRISEYSLFTISTKLAYKFFGFTIGLLLLPLTLLLHVMGFRVIDVFPQRVGHLALEPDCLAKEIEMGLIKNYKFLMVVPIGSASNNHLLTYWSEHFRIVEKKIPCFLLINMSRWGMMKYSTRKYARTFNGAQHAYRIQAEWGLRPPVLKLSNDDELWSSVVFQKLGIPNGAWFVCVHARETGYSIEDDGIQAYRNSNIHNMHLAITEIQKRGGIIVRMGDATMTPLKASNGIIDYANCKLKSDRLDIILCAKAKFFLGNTSGLALVSTVFGVPCAITNSIPYSSLWFTANDICIHKLIFSERANIILSYQTILNSRIANYNFTSNYIENDLRLIENTPNDIHDLVLDMFDQLDGRLFNKDISDGIILLYTAKHFCHKTSARISERFLRRHPELLARNQDAA